LRTQTGARRGSAAGCGAAARCRCWAAAAAAAGQQLRATTAVERVSLGSGLSRPTSRGFAEAAGGRTEITRARDQMEQIQQMQRMEQEQADDRSKKQRQVAARRRKQKPRGRQRQHPKAKKKPQKPTLAEIKEQIQTQIEYYFSDFMVPHTDTRLTSAIAADKDGWVPLETIMAYKRIHDLGEQVYDFGPAVVTDALEKSALIEMNRVRSAVRRRYPFGEQGHDFVPLDEEERRTWRTLCAFKTAPVHQSSSAAGNDQPGCAGVVTAEMSFPPQTKEERAVVHRLAHILGLQHQSKGKGAKHAKQRYVIVRKRAAAAT
jgi:hypothetical protein